MKYTIFIINKNVYTIITTRNDRGKPLWKLETKKNVSYDKSKALWMKFNQVNVKRKKIKIKLLISRFKFVWDFSKI